MTKLRSMLAAVLIATGCESAPPVHEPTPAEKAAAPKGSCFCKSGACLCGHCSTGKGDCSCKK